MQPRVLCARGSLTFTFSDQNNRKSSAVGKENDSKRFNPVCELSGDFEIINARWLFVSLLLSSIYSWNFSKNLLTLGICLLRFCLLRSLAVATLVWLWKEMHFVEIKVILIPILIFSIQFPLTVWLIIKLLVSRFMSLSLITIFSAVRVWKKRHDLLCLLITDVRRFNKVKLNPCKIIY